MNVNVSQIVDELNRWELVIDGHATRCPTLAEAAVLDRLARAEAKADADQAALFHEIRAHLWPLFVEPGPQLSQWTDEAVGVALAVLMAYTSDRAQKKTTGFQTKMRELFPELLSGAGSPRPSSASPTPPPAR